LIPRITVFSVIFSALTGLAHAESPEKYNNRFLVDFTLSHHQSAIELSECFSRIGSWWPSDHTWSGDASNMEIDLREGGLFRELVEGKWVTHLTVKAVDLPASVELYGGLGPLSAMGATGPMTINFSDDELKVRYLVTAEPMTDLSGIDPAVQQVMRMQFQSLIDYCD
jgi:hypothetical protein